MTDAPRLVKYEVLAGEIRHQYDPRTFKRYDYGPLETKEVYLAADVQRVLMPFLKSVECHCLHSRLFSSQEWDRRHENWCLYQEAQRLLAALKEGSDG